MKSMVLYVIGTILPASRRTTARHWFEVKLLIVVVDLSGSKRPFKRGFKRIQFTSRLARFRLPAVSFKLSDHLPRV